jgi:c-di-AMP phosphodiesterase-like protein
MNQNYQNHRRFHPIYHYILSVLILLTLVGAISFVIRNGISLLATLILAIVVILLIMFSLIRQYPLKAQDRAIRAEENLRHYVLAGKLFDERLTIRQITALRFASDAELPKLSEKAASQNLSPEDIKKQITNWKADYYRV